MLTTLGELTALILIAVGVALAVTVPVGLITAGVELLAVCAWLEGSPAPRIRRRKPRPAAEDDTWA